MVTATRQFKWFATEVAVKVVNQITITQAVIITHPVCGDRFTVKFTFF